MARLRAAELAEVAALISQLVQKMKVAQFAPSTLSRPPTERRKCDSDKTVVQMKMLMRVPGISRHIASKL